MQVDYDLAAHPIDIVATFAPHAIAASVRGSVSSPLSLSVEMSPFWQNAHRMLQEVKKIVPEPSVPR
jgi:hypothetical protein